MISYLSYTFEDNEDFVNTFDEVPLWSASFGLLLLKHLQLKPNLTILDLGSGTGFPLMELASRLGPSCQLYGLDTWTNANLRAKQKIKNYGLTNVQIIECSAEKIPFGDGTIDLIVSNLGINNFNNPAIVFNECYRVLKPNGKLALTTNLNGHWKEFYALFYLTLQQLGKDQLIPALKKDEAHRGTIETVFQLFTENNFEICQQYEDVFNMNFLDGSAFLNHHFVKLGWLESWMGLFPKEELEEIFLALEQNLNSYSEKNGGLLLSVPMLFMEGTKIS